MSQTFSCQILILCYDADSCESRIWKISRRSKLYSRVTDIMSCIQSWLWFLDPLVIFFFFSFYGQLANSFRECGVRIYNTTFLLLPMCHVVIGWFGHVVLSSVLWLGHCLDCLQEFLVQSLVLCINIPHVSSSLV